MILIVSTCKEKIHELEFVKPIERILYNIKEPFFVRHYSKLSKKDVIRGDKIIIAGTSLMDNQFTHDLKYFNFIKNSNKPLLGICAGMQIISLIFGAKIKHKKEIGYYKENFTTDFLSLSGEQEVYHLHNNYTSLPKDFVSFTKSSIPQAIKHKSKEIYGVLFHPEVRNELVIRNFVNS